MKGNKLVIAVILALIVCLVLIPTCAFADEAVSDDQQEVQQTEQQTEQQPAPTAGSGEKSAQQPGTLEESGKGDSSDNDEGKNLPESGDKEAADPASGDKEPAENETEDSGDVSKEAKPAEEKTPADDASKSEEGTSGGENVPLQPESGSSFKVILSYGDKSVELNDLKGGEQNDLAAIVSQLGIEGDIESAQGDADELFSAANEDGWKLVTSKAFGTKQTLALVVGGVEYVIDVADDRSAYTTQDIIDIINDSTGNEWTIKLEQDIELKSYTLGIDSKGYYKNSLEIPTGKTITIDLNGHKLSRSYNNVCIANYGKLTIKDSSANRTGKISAGNQPAIVNYADAELTLNGGTIISGKGIQYTGGKIIVNDGVKFECEPDFYGGWSIAPLTGGSPSESAEIVINGGEFSKSVISEPSATDNSTKLTINGGTFHESAKSSGSGSELIINNGTFNSSTFDGGVESSSHANLVINNGTFNGKVKSISRANLVINNGTFNNDVYARNADVTVNNGTFNNRVYVVGIYRNETTNITVYDGMFNGYVFQTGISFDAVGGIYTNKNVKTLTGKNYIVVTADGKYAVNKSGYALAKDAREKGKSIEVVKAPDGAKIDDVPVGVKIFNNSGNTIYINGVAVKDGKTYTVPEPKPAEESKTAASAPLYAKYFVIEGKGQQWTDGDLEFVLNSNEVVKVLIDGVEVEFTVAEDGTVTIASTVIEALEAGTHEIEFIFADGSCMTTFTK